MTYWEGLAPIPIRVLVKGASNTVAVSPPGGPRTHQAYSWWLEALLRSAGLPAFVRNAGVEGQKITQALCDWEEEVEQWAPDVVVLSYGMYEAMPGLLPHSLERHATGWHRHTGQMRERYRQKILTPGWRRLARLQRRFDAQMPRPGPFRSSPEEFVAELARYVTLIRQVGSPLVLVTDTYPIWSPWREWFPGMDARVKVNDAAMREWIANLGEPDVRLFPWSASITGDREEATPDGVHFSAEQHRLIAEALAREILAWAAGQPHLQHPGMDPSRYDPPWSESAS